MPLPAQQPQAPLAPGQVFAEPNQSREILRLEPTPPFRLRFRPDLWEVVEVGLEGPALVPQLSCLWLMPGCNGVFGVTSKRTADDVVALATTKSAEKHFRILDPNLPIPTACLPAGVKPGGYLATSPCRGANKVVAVRHHERFVTYAPQFEGAAREVWHMDCRNRWLVWLVSQGVFGQPGAAVLDRLSGQARDAYERALTVPWPQEIRADRVGRARRPLEALQKAQTALEGSDDAAPIVAPTDDGHEPEPVERARANGWEYADLTGAGEGNVWDDRGGRSPRSGLTMAEMAAAPAPPGWADVARSCWPWECTGWTPPKAFRRPKVAPKEAPRG